MIIKAETYRKTEVEKNIEKQRTIKLKRIYKRLNALQLTKLDMKVSRPRVARLMKKARTRSIVKRKFSVTTDSEHKYPVIENKLNREFKVE
jgi:DNA-binding transcriptional regulator LsrR (DeoR family)